jgi:hypothetical protein
MEILTSPQNSVRTTLLNHEEIKQISTNSASFPMDDFIFLSEVQKFQGIVSHLKAQNLVPDVSGNQVTHIKLPGDIKRTTSPWSLSSQIFYMAALLSQFNEDNQFGEFCHYLIQSFNTANSGHRTPHADMASSVTGERAYERLPRFGQFYPAAIACWKCQDTVVKTNVYDPKKLKDSLLSFLVQKIESPLSEQELWNKLTRLKLVSDTSYYFLNIERIIDFDETPEDELVLRDPLAPLLCKLTQEFVQNRPYEATAFFREQLCPGDILIIPQYNIQEDRISYYHGTEHLTPKGEGVRRLLHMGLIADRDL